MRSKKAILWGVTILGVLGLTVMLATVAFAQGPAGLRGVGLGMMGSEYPYSCGQGMGMSGMAGRLGGQPSPNTSRLQGEEVWEAVANYLATYHPDPDLEVAEIMEFENNFYVQIRERSTAVNAFELLVDPYTGVVGPEYGPNMMWNTQYGHMRGIRGMMMHDWEGWGNDQPTADMPISSEQAMRYAQRFLDVHYRGLTAGEPETFYGYYTLHTFDGEGKIAGMLSVNGYNGRVWYHTWHGRFVGMVGEEDEGQG